MDIIISTLHKEIEFLQSKFLGQGHQGIVHDGTMIWILASVTISHMVVDNFI